jgi:hypothetical protein
MAILMLFRLGLLTVVAVAVTFLGQSANRIDTALLQSTLWWSSVQLPRAVSLQLVGAVVDEAQPMHRLANQSNPHFCIACCCCCSIEVNRNWAPLGAEQLYKLVKAGFYDDNAFFRVIKGFVVQVCCPSIARSILVAIDRLIPTALDIVGYQWQEVSQ